MLLSQDEYLSAVETFEKVIGLDLQEAPRLLKPEFDEVLCAEISVLMEYDKYAHFNPTLGQAKAYTREFIETNDEVQLAATYFPGKTNALLLQKAGSDLESMANLDHELGHAVVYQNAGVNPFKIAKNVMLKKIVNEMFPELFSLMLENHYFKSHKFDGYTANCTANRFFESIAGNASQWPEAKANTYRSNLATAKQLVEEKKFGQLKNFFSKTTFNYRLSNNFIYHNATQWPKLNQEQKIEFIETIYSNPPTWDEILDVLNPELYSQRVKLPKPAKPTFFDKIKNTFKSS